MAEIDANGINGIPLPGATLTPTGCSFAIYSESARCIWLCLFDSEGQEQRYRLDQRHGSLWYTHVTGVKAGQAYGYRVEQQGFAPGNLHKLLLDPYAKTLSAALRWHESFYWLQDELHGVDSVNSVESVNSAPHIAKSLVTENLSALPQLKSAVDPNSRVIYELHVKGFTQLHPQVPAEYRGKYLGLCQPAVIAYLQSLGVTTLQLMPCFSFMDEARLANMGMQNYWGYNPINFFTPDWRYAVADPVAEFRTMVERLHEAGLEVILDVVYNHTAEGELKEGMLSYKGIDAGLYYRHHAPEVPDYLHTSNTHQTSTFLNYSGCGNSLRTEHPVVMRLVMDSLRHWVKTFGIDGFRFDLGASLLRHDAEAVRPLLRRAVDSDHGWGSDQGRDGGQGRIVSQMAPLIQAMSQDPVLQQALLLAEPWDIGPNGYQLGAFPGDWLEVNDRFRDSMRAFCRHDKTGVAELSTRLMGSRDIFPKGRRPSYSSVNHVTYHDGFTLQDLVSYQHRHNQANGEQGRDGHGHNLSCNHGVEGPTDNPDILARRELHQKNLLALLLLSRGTPHLLAGDEFGQSQQGNNNGYCQDNSTTWLNWSGVDHRTTLLSFCRRLIRLRRQEVSLSALQLADEHHFGYQPPISADELEGWDTVLWLDQKGELMSEAHWHDPHQSFLSLMIFRGSRAQHQVWVLTINAGDDAQEFRSAQVPNNHQWTRLMITVNDGAEDKTKIPEPGQSETASMTFLCPANSIALWLGMTNDQQNQS